MSHTTVEMLWGSFFCLKSEDAQAFEIEVQKYIF